MPVPKPANWFLVVQGLWDSSGDLPQQGATEEQRQYNGARFLRLVVAEIRARGDLTAGLWRKGTPWGHDGDKVCFKMPQGGVFFVDIIGRSGAPDCFPTWQDGDDAYYPLDDQSNWMPSYGDLPDPAPSPTPAPPVDVAVLNTLLKAINDELVAIRTLVEALPQRRFAVRTEHGWLSLQPDGRLEFRSTSDPAQPGPWEIAELVPRG